MIGAQGNTYLAVLTSRTNAESGLAFGRLDGLRFVAIDGLSLSRNAAEGDALGLAASPSGQLVAVIRTMRGGRPGDAGILAVGRAGDPETAGQALPPTPRPAATARPSPTAAPTPTPLVLQAARPATSNTATVLVAAGAFAGVVALGLSAVVGLRRRN